MVLSIETLMKCLDTLTSSPDKAAFTSSEADVADTLLDNLCKKLDEIKDVYGQHLADVTRENVCHVYAKVLFVVLRDINETFAEEMAKFKLEELSALKSPLTEHTVPKLQPDVLSVSQQVLLSKAYQFVVALAIVPHLLPGVGVPMSSRSKHGSVISTLVKTDMDSLKDNVIKLVDVTRPSNVSAIFLSRHLIDLLAALMQLVRMERNKEVSGGSHSSSSDEDIRFNAKEELSSVITKSYPPLIVRHLLMLQSGSGVKPPGWLLAMCGHYLTQILTSPNGVKSIVSGIVTSETDDWRKFKLVGTVIATPPKSWHVDQYYQLVFPQVIGLLDEDSRILVKQYSRVVSAVIAAMGEKYFGHVSKYFWIPIVADLTGNCAKKQENAILTLFKVVCCGTEPHSSLIEELCKIFPDLFTIFLHSYDQVVVSDMRLCCDELMTTCLKYLSHVTAAKTIYEILFPRQGRIDDPVELDLQAEDNKMKAAVSVIEKMKDKYVMENLFSLALQDLTENYEQDSTTVASRKDELSSLTFRIRCMSLLATLCDKYSSVCLKHPKLVINFVKATLSHYLSAETSSDILSDLETISLALGLLTALLGGASDIQLSEDDVKLLQDLNSPLRELSLLGGLPDDMRELVLNVQVAIATQGLVRLSKDSNTGLSNSYNNENLDSKSKHGEKINPRQTRQAGKGRKLVEEIRPAIATTAGSNLAESSSSTRADNSQQFSPDNSDSSRLYHQALAELTDSLIAVKGHALIELHKLIKRKDKTTLKNHCQLLELLIQHLSHTDSYIYLNAISALSALADVYPHDVLPDVCKEFGNTNLVTETRLKIGEVITKATRCLGDLAPGYADLILPTVLIGCKSVDSLLKASSLVNVGEICKLLGYTLGNNVQEVVECLSASLSDSTPDARKAAAYSVSLIISGLGKRCFDVLGGEGLTRLYRTLKSCVYTQTDDVFIHHCTVAIETIDNEVKSGYLNPSRTMEKKIYILDAPP